jgi:hypothetical protein
LWDEEGWDALDLKFMQDLHNKEFTTRESLANRASTIIAALTTLGGLVVFIAVNFKSGEAAVTFIFWLFIAASVLMLGTAAFYLIRSYNVPALNDLAKPTEWLTYWNELKQDVADGKLASAETEFTDYLLRQYAEIGDHNIDANFKRGARLVKSNNFVLTSFVLIVVTSLVFYCNNYILGNSSATKGVAKMLSKDALFCLPAGQDSGWTGKSAEVPVKDALVCIPAEQAFDAAGGPKPRPVPSPAPHKPPAE